MRIDRAEGMRGCPDCPVDFHWVERRQDQPINCNRCDNAGRGEAQSPLWLGRLRDVIAPCDRGTQRTAHAEKSYRGTRCGKRMTYRDAE